MMKAADFLLNCKSCNHIKEFCNSPKCTIYLIEDASKALFDIILVRQFRFMGNLMILWK